MKRVLFITIGLSVFLFSCAERAKNDTSKQITIPSQPSAQEKKSDESLLLINDDYIQTLSISNNNKNLADKNLYKLKTFTQLHYGVDRFLYYILKELNFGDTFKSFLIYEYCELESIIWLANYDKDYNFIDAITVYYGSTGISVTTTSKIYQDQRLIELTEYNPRTDPKTYVWEVKITSEGKIEINK